ncbi:B12-binding domain-containing radical SAM protein [Patescibacteria group bacterium]|nr:B12-binding domain-containing radical SAM protein [Patescibacteria group bacterium]
MKRNIILINPPLYFSKGVPHSLDSTVPPLGIMYLASYINQNSTKFKASIIDITPEKLSLQQLISKIKKLKPFAIGISSMTPQLQGTVELAKSLKSNLAVRKCKVFLGGPHISADPDFINRFPDLFDYAITGEAEIAFLDSLNKLNQKKPIPKIQAGKTPLNLDTLPINHNLIKRQLYNQRQSIMFSRGCPFKCYYCSRPAISKITRYRSAQNLIKEIKATYPYHQGKLDFQDDTLTLNHQKVLEFCKLIIKEDLNLNWRCNTRIDLVNQPLLKAMKQAGCELIHFGIEAGNEKIRQRVVKKGSFTNQDIKKVIALCKKLNIKFAGYFIIGHPGEGKKQLNQTKNMILNSKIDLVGLSIPTPFPGSELFEIAQKQGIISKKIIDQFAKKELGQGYAGVYPVFTNNKVSIKYIYNLMAQINRSFYLKPRVLLNRLKQDILSISKLKQDLLDLTSLVFKGMSSRKPYIKPGQIK